MLVEVPFPEAAGGGRRGSLPDQSEKRRPGTAALQKSTVQRRRLDRSGFDGR